MCLDRSRPSSYEKLQLLSLYTQYISIMVPYLRRVIFLTFLPDRFLPRLLYPSLTFDITELTKPAETRGDDKLLIPYRVCACASVCGFHVLLSGRRRRRAEGATTFSARLDLSSIPDKTRGKSVIIRGSDTTHQYVQAVSNRDISTKDRECQLGSLLLLLLECHLLQ